MEKLYVDVRVQFSKEGQMTPVAIFWSNGRRYDIAKVLDMRRSASTKVGGTGFRYTVIVEGRERFLWFEDTNCYSVIGGRWFIESQS